MMSARAIRQHKTCCGEYRGLNKVEEIETGIGYAQEIDPATLADYDALVDRHP